MVQSSSSKKIDELLSVLTAFPPPSPSSELVPEDEFESGAARLIQLLNRQGNVALAGNIAGGENILEVRTIYMPMNLLRVVSKKPQVIDPKLNSISYLWVLFAYGKVRYELPIDAATDKDTLALNNSFWRGCQLFCEQFELRQIKYAGSKWRDLLDLMANLARAADMPTLAIGPIKAAILRMDPNSSTFTSNHHLFVSLCLEAKCFRAALPILELDIHEFPANLPINTSYGLPPFLNPNSSSYITKDSNIAGKITYQLYLEYYLYGAMIYMYLRKWSKALDFLTYVITAPVGSHPSMIMVEAYKKWILVGLIYKGAVLRFPSQTASVSTRTLQSAARAYEGIAILFERGEAMKLQEEIAEGEEIWTQDQNTGLVNQTVQAFRRFSLLSLERIYASLPLSTAAQYDPLGGSISATETLLLDMISTGDLNAAFALPSSTPSEELSSTPSSSTEDTMLHLHGPSTTALGGSSEAAQLEAVEAALARLTELNKRIKVADRRLALGKDYVTHISKARKSRETALGAGGEGRDSARQGLWLGDRGLTGGGGIMMDIDEDEDLMG